jgi:transposase
MDNAIIHKSKLIRETIEYDNNHLLYSVPYHPETNRNFLVNITPFSFKMQILY